MPTYMPSVSVCFPAYNEAATVGPVLWDAHRLLAQTSLDYEIIVCDDGSSDSTGMILAEAAESIARLRVFRHEKNQGIFRTFEDLYAAATKEFVFLNSTDGQWSTSILLDLLPMMDHLDCVVASRRCKHYGWGRSVVSAGFRLICRVAFGVETYDPGAVKLMRREILQGIPTVSTSPFVEGERLVRAVKAGYRVGQYPVDVAPRKHGRSKAVKPSVLVASIRDVWRTWLALRSRFPTS